MPVITEEEKLRRHRINESVIGTHVMEGLAPDPTTAEILERYANGALTLDAFSSAMDQHAHELLQAKQKLAGRVNRGGSAL